MKRISLEEDQEEAGVVRDKEGHIKTSDGMNVDKGEEWAHIEEEVTANRSRLEEPSSSSSSSNNITSPADESMDVGEIGKQNYPQKLQFSGSKV